MFAPVLKLVSISPSLAVLLFHVCCPVRPIRFKFSSQKINYLNDFMRGVVRACARLVAVFRFAWQSETLVNTAPMS
jgi:hypothetical protein